MRMNNTTENKIECTILTIDFANNSVVNRDDFFQAFVYRTASRLNQ